MSGEVFDQNHQVTFGNPWHGALRDTTLLTEVGVEITGAIAAPTPHTHLVEFPGLPVPVTPDADLPRGIKWKNHAILIGDTRRYSPISAISFGRNTHVYLTEDRTHYHVSVVGEAVSGSIASGGAWSLSLSVTVKKATNGALAAPVTVVAGTNLSITGVGSGAGYYSQLSNFSPDGKKLAIAIHKFQTATHAGSQRDIRRSLGVAGLWEVVLSGGSADAPPSAVLTRLKSSAECQVASETAGADILQAPEVTLGVSSTSFGSALDENGNALPDGQSRFYGTQTDSVVMTPRPWGRTFTKQAIIGAAYDVNNVLMIFMAESVAVETSTVDYSGPAPGLIERSIDAILTSGLVSRWIVHPPDIAYAYSSVAIRTTTFSIKVGDVAAVSTVMVETFTDTRSGTLTFNNYAVEITSGYVETSNWTKTINGAPSTATSVDAMMTSNNTACSLIGLDAFGFAAPSGAVGAAQTLALDGAGMLWAAWNPKTGTLTTTPGYSWC